MTIIHSSKIHWNTGKAGNTHRRSDTPAHHGCPRSKTRIDLDPIARPSDRTLEFFSFRLGKENDISQLSFAGSVARALAMSCEDCYWKEVIHVSTSRTDPGRPLCHCRLCDSVLLACCIRAVVVFLTALPLTAASISDAFHPVTPTTKACYRARAVIESVALLNKTKVVKLVFCLS